MRWSLRCTSTGSRAVALPCGASSSATTSASKKSLRAAEQDRPDVARARRCWKQRQAMLNSTRLVFIDETAANTKMVRLSGRCPRGGLRRNGMTAPCVIDGSMSGKTFLAYVEQSLAPALKRKDIVVMDNLPAHKVPGVCEAIEARGATLRYLPQYLPDLNPIEMPFSKLKADLRKDAERTVPRLCRRIDSFARRLSLPRHSTISGMQA